MGEMKNQVFVDTFNRVHTDLRISVTDRCNFRCQYCMPSDGLEWLPKAELLTFEEIFEVAELCVKRFGIKSIRLTGGEPTLRAQLPKLVEMLATLDVDLAMTTNGVSLPKLAGELAEAGLNRLNISLDSLNAKRFEELTRRDELDRVLKGIQAAKDAGFGNLASETTSAPIKINMVVMAGKNDDEILDFIEFGRSSDVTIRFIEYMPLDADEAWSRERVVGLAEILNVVSSAYNFEPVESNSENSGENNIENSSEPALKYRFMDSDNRNKNSGFMGGNDKHTQDKHTSGGEVFGVIASVTKSFCHLCDRVRLTADGQFRNCLFSTDEYDLRSIIRSQDPIEKRRNQMADTIAKAVHKKWAGHSIDQPHFIRPSRSMSQIGG